MKLHRNFLICVLAVAAVLLCLLALPQSAQAASVSDLTFTLNAAGDGYIVSDCKSSATGELVIPATYNGKPVTSIGEWAFSSCKSLSSITIPDSVTSIGNYAFYYCTSLTSVTIPEGVTNIGDFAFDRCSGLTSVVIPNSVAWMGYSVFISCDLSSVIYCGTSEEWDAVVKGEYLSNHPAEFGPDAPMPDPITDEVLQFHNYKDSVCTICGDAAAFSPLTFTLNAAGDGYIVSDCDTSATGELVIPATYNGLPVTEIGDSAFYNCTGLTGITIPAGVTSIGDKAFNACDNLSSLQVAEGNTVYHSAGNCIIKTDVKAVIFGCKTSQIPTDESVKVIGRGAFYNCKALTEMVIPNNITMIGGSAFSGCTGLTSISIPASVTAINNSTFSGCTKLTNVIYCGTQEQWDTIEKGISNDPLLNVALQFHNYDNGVCTVCGDGTAISPLTFVLNDDGNGYIVSYCDTSFTGELVIPAIFNGLPVTGIGNWVFCECYDLTSIIIPDSVTSIGRYAFCYSGLSKMTITDSVTSIGSDAFLGCYGLANIDVYIADASAWCKAGISGDLYNSGAHLNLLDTNGNEITNVILDDTVTAIPDYAFKNCTSLTSVTIPNSVTSIGFDAFASCTGLTSITIPDSVTTIGASAFYRCTGLTSVIISNGVTKIGASAFSGCTGLAGISIPDSVTSVGDYAFNGCTGLTEIAIPNGVTAISNFAFYGCSKLARITLPDSVTSIGEKAFYECKALTEITIPNGVTTISDYAFYGCTGMTSVTIGNGVTSIGYSAFRHCDRLTSITIPASVTSIGERAFNACDNLSSLQVAEGNTVYHSAGNCIIKTGSKTLVAGCKTSRIPTDGSVKTIGAFAFYGCKSLTEIVLPESITTISGSAFCHCAQLTDISITDSVTSIGDSAFNNCTKLATVIYCGTQEQWNAMTVSDGNTYLKNATLQFHNYENGVCTVCGHKNEDVSLPQTVTTSVAVSGDTAYRGDTITVTISATAVERCNSGGFVFDFDTSAFEYVSGKALVGGFTNAGVSTENGRIAGYFMGNEATVQGDLFQITLRVKDGASFTEHTISGTSSFGVKTNGVTQNISGTNNDAKVTVVCNHSFGDWIPVDEIWRKHICTICSYEETAYAEYTVTFQYADGTVISSTQYRYGDEVVVPDAPPAQERNYIFTGWDKKITAVCNGDCVYTAVFVAYILGDMDGDGITTHEDAIYLLLNVMFGDEFYPLSNAPADMNDNGIVDANDAVYLLLHILFGEAFYPLDKG